MANSFFSFKQFTIYQDGCAMKVTTDACLFGAWCADEIKKGEIIKSCLDIGTGTGLLSLMAAQKNHLAIDAVEIDEQASAQAKTNVAASPFQNKINIINKDISLFGKEDYDIIISNPPFYENELEASTENKNAARHCLHLTWENLLQIITKKLASNGYFFLLLPFKRKKELENLLEQQHLYAHTTVYVKQTINHSPFRIMIKGSKRKTNTCIEEIAICDGYKQYTSQFKHLLKAYYLYLADEPNVLH